ATMWIEELQRDLAGRLLEIWQGVNIDPVKAEKYRRRWRQAARDEGRQATFGSKGPERRSDCVYLGLPTQPPGRRTDAAGEICCCRGKWLHRCEVHGQCTIGEPRPDVACCQSCDRYDGETDRSSIEVDAEPAAAALSAPVSGKIFPGGVDRRRCNEYMYTIL